MPNYPSNTSATGGYLQPGSSYPFTWGTNGSGWSQGYWESGPTPPDDDAIDDFMQSVVAGITGLPDPLVRPRWQPEPPNIPNFRVDWAAVGVMWSEPEAGTPWVGHFDRSGYGIDEEREHETFELLCSFYGPRADYNARLLRNGLYIEQNRAQLATVSVGLVEVQRATLVPELIKERWTRRIDLPVIFRRQFRRIYPVLSLVSAQGTISTNSYTRYWTVPTVAYVLPVGTFWNDGGVLAMTRDIEGFPITPVGLPAGAVWSNGLLVTVIPGMVPDPFAPPEFFPGITPEHLLAIGGGNLPLSPQATGSGQLWNNGGVVSIS